MHRQVIDARVPNVVGGEHRAARQGWGSARLGMAGGLCKQQGQRKKGEWDE